MLNTTLHIPPEDDAVDHSAERVLIGILMACFIAICVTVLVLMGWWLRTVSLAERRRAVRRLSLGGHNPLQRRNSFDSTGSEAKVQFVTPFMPFRVNPSLLPISDTGSQPAEDTAGELSPEPEVQFRIDLPERTLSTQLSIENLVDADVKIAPRKRIQKQMSAHSLMRTEGSDSSHTDSSGSSLMETPPASPLLLSSFSGIKQLTRTATEARLRDPEACPSPKSARVSLLKLNAEAIEDVKDAKDPDTQIHLAKPPACD